MLTHAKLRFAHPVPTIKPHHFHVNPYQTMSNLCQTHAKQRQNHFITMKKPCQTTSKPCQFTSNDIKLHQTKSIYVKKYQTTSLLCQTMSLLCHIHVKPHTNYVKPTSALAYLVFYRHASLLDCTSYMQAMLNFKMTITIVPLTDATITNAKTLSSFKQLSSRSFNHHHQ